MIIKLKHNDDREKDIQRLLPILLREDNFDQQGVCYIHLEYKPHNGGVITLPVLPTPYSDIEIKVVGETPQSMLDDVLNVLFNYEKQGTIVIKSECDDKQTERLDSILADLQTELQKLPKPLPEYVTQAQSLSLLRSTPYKFVKSIFDVLMNYSTNKQEAEQ